MSKLKVLLAEDNPGDVLLVEEAFAKYQVTYEMFVVRDGGQALDFIARMGEAGGDPCPDVVLLDLNLPKVDGSDILVALRKHPQCAQTPVIVITSSDAVRDRERMDALGVTCYFRKPSDLEAFLELGALVQRVVQDAERADNLARGQQKH